MDMPDCYEGFCLITGVKKGIGNHLVEHVEVYQDAGRRHCHMLVDVPANAFPISSVSGRRKPEPSVAHTRYECQRRDSKQW